MISKTIVVTGLLCITFLEACALFNGINGVLLTTVIAVIAAVIGVAVPTPKALQKIIKA